MVGAVLKAALRHHEGDFLAVVFRVAAAGGADGPIDRHRHLDRLRRGVEATDDLCRQPRRRQVDLLVAAGVDQVDAHCFRRDPDFELRRPPSDEGAVGAEAVEGVGVRAVAEECVAAGDDALQAGNLSFVDHAFVELVGVVDDHFAHCVLRPGAQQGLAVDGPGRRRAEDVGEGREDVDRRCGMLVDDSGAPSGFLDQQRHQDDLGVVVAVRSAARRAGAKARAVVGGDDDQGVVEDFGLPQRVEQLAEQAVGIARLEEVALPRLDGRPAVAAPAVADQAARAQPGGGAGIFLARRQVAPRHVGQFQVQDVQRPPSGGFEGVEKAREESANVAVAFLRIGVAEILSGSVRRLTEARPIVAHRRQARAQARRQQEVGIEDRQVAQGGFQPRSERCGIEVRTERLGAEPGQGFEDVQTVSGLAEPGEEALRIVRRRRQPAPVRAAAGEDRGHRVGRAGGHGGGVAVVEGGRRELGEGGEAVRVDLAVDIEQGGEGEFVEDHQDDGNVAVEFVADLDGGVERRRIRRPEGADLGAQEEPSRHQQCRRGEKGEQPEHGGASEAQDESGADGQRGDHEKRPREREAADELEGQRGDQDPHRGAVRPGAQAAGPGDQRGEGGGGQPGDEGRQRDQGGAFEAVGDEKFRLPTDQVEQRLRRRQRPEREEARHAARGRPPGGRRRRRANSPRHRSSPGRARRGRAARRSACRRPAPGRR